MGLWNKLFGTKPTRQTPARSITWDQAYQSGLVTGPVRSGVSVNEQTALTLSTVWRAARVVSESVGTMPCKVYKRTATGRDEHRDHPLWNIVHDEPNPDTSAVDFFTLLQFHAVLWGNAYAEVERDGAGQVLALHPVEPWRVRVERDAGGLVYLVDGGPEKGGTTLTPADVVHVRGPSPDGTEGYHLVHLARESFGFSLACDQFGASFFGNAARPSGVLETPGQLTSTAAENLKKSFDLMYRGLDNTGRVAVLEEGMKWTPTTITNEAGQYDQTRQFQVLEICRWIGVDPTLVFAFGSNPGGVAEQQQRNFLTFTLNPWLRKWESEINRKCVPLAERGEVYAEFVRESILSMTAKEQADVWAVGVSNGWIEPAEVRAWLNLAPLAEPAPEPEPVQPEPDVVAPDVGGLVTIADKVASGEYTPEAATNIMLAAYPDLAPDLVAGIVTPLVPAPEPVAAPVVDPNQPAPIATEDNGTPIV